LSYKAIGRSELNVSWCMDDHSIDRSLKIHVLKNNETNVEYQDCLTQITSPMDEIRAFF